MVIPAVWLQALITVPAALVVSSVSLLYRYRQKGHPFGSLKAAAWAVLVIVVTAAPAALALLLPRVPPAYLGVAVPMALGIRGDRLQKRSQPTEQAVWYQVVTLGVRLLLDHLEQQMDTDRDNWCEEQISHAATLDQLDHAAFVLYSKLAGRDSMRRYQPRLKSHRDAVYQAVNRAHAAELSGLTRDADKARHTAEEALTRMLQLAYDCGHAAAALIPLQPSSTARA